MRPIAAIACLFLCLLFCGRAASQPVNPLTDVLIFSTDEGAKAGGETNYGGGDSSQLFTIRNILIAGNKRTQPDVILRELSFQVNEAYPIETITAKFQKARKQLMNSGLFMNVTVSLKSISGYDVYVNVEVVEKWYIWPKPFIRTVDKTFHQWWHEQNRSMDRINYGLRLTHNNFTGRNDKLKVNIMNGYTKQLSVQYYGLFLDNALKWSINGGVSVGRNREVNYMTRNNKLVPVKDADRYLRTYVSWFGEVSYRPAIKTKHTFGIGYSYEDIADTVFKLNPRFSEGRQPVRAPELSYRLSYFDVDFIPYPTKGVIGELSLSKKGFNDPINLWQLRAKGSKTWPAGKGLFFSASAVGMLKLPLRQPYVTNQFIGYDDQYLQGYEYYVIDGVAGGYARATLTRQLVNTQVNISSRKFRRLNAVPLKIYAKTFVNSGYIYNPDPGRNGLTNKILYSGGIGIDIVTFTDFVIKIEWSFNRLGENGLYLHKRNYF